MHTRRTVGGISDGGKEGEAKQQQQWSEGGGEARASLAAGVGGRVPRWTGQGRDWRNEGKERAREQPKELALFRNSDGCVMRSTCKQMAWTMIRPECWPCSPTPASEPPARLEEGVSLLGRKIEVHFLLNLAWLAHWPTAFSCS